MMSLRQVSGAGWARTVRCREAARKALDSASAKALAPAWHGCIKLNVRTFDTGVRKRILAAIERIARAEAAASGAPRPPAFTTLDHYPLGFNDAEASKRVGDAFRRHFDPVRVRQVGAAPASEDFGSFGTAWGTPSMFWFVGGTDPEVYAKAKAAGEINKIPVNHSPYFAPVLHPTLEAGVEAMVVAALAWLAAPAAAH
jgi:hippurate hydrolase